MALGVSEGPFIGKVAFEAPEVEVACMLLKCALQSIHPTSTSGASARFWRKMPNKLLTYLSSTNPDSSLGAVQAPDITLTVRASVVSRG